MKKKLCIFFIVALFILSGCNNKEDNKSREKIEAELEYIDTKIFNLADKLNNVSLKKYEITSKETEMKKEENSEDEKESKESSEDSGKGEEDKNATTMEIEKTTILDGEINESEIDWQNMKTEIEIINNIWSVVSIDLRNEKVADNDIEEFNNILNQTMISIKNEDRKMSLQNISDLYAFIPNFMNYISIDNHKKTVKATKSELLKAYTVASLNEWEQVSTHVINAQNTFFTMSDNKESLENKEFKINKIERLIKNLDNSSKLKDLQVFLLHYKTLIENIDTI